jgi:hypothetical protein
MTSMAPRATLSIKWHKYDYTLHYNIFLCFRARNPELLTYYATLAA